MDTIFAKSSGTGKAGVAIFRISGEQSLNALNLLLKDYDVGALVPNMMYYKKLYIPSTDELIDEGMVVYFKAPASFTGEDVVELHLHGSIAINKIIIHTLSDIKGLRMAEAGEFAKRAFLNGKFDLTGAEGLADLIEAETMLQHKQAIRQKSGYLESLYTSWREKLITIIALLEAYIDFPDEKIPDEVLSQTMEIVTELKDAIRSHLADNRRGERLRSGIKLSILGEPNVGKSSLLNFLLQREAAIVSDIAGTTRDIIEGHLDIGGYPIIIQDTAGIRYDSEDTIEREGIKRSLQAAADSDIKIIMFDANVKASKEYLKNIEQYIDDNTILVNNKIDLRQTVDNRKHAKDNLSHREGNLIHPELVSGSKISQGSITYNCDYHASKEILKQVQDDPNCLTSSLHPIIPLHEEGNLVINDITAINISIKDNISLDQLLAKIIMIAENLAGLKEEPQITRERHRAQLNLALQSLENFSMEQELELACEDIRITTRALSGITGIITVEEILGEIFGKFCIGK